MKRVALLAWPLASVASAFAGAAFGVGRRAALFSTPPAQDGDEVELADLDFPSLKELMSEMDGPSLTGLSLEAARVVVEEFLQSGEAPLDIEAMSVAELAALMEELGGPAVGTLDLGEARDSAWAYVQTLEEHDHDEED
mmetsp:Transcript_8424/g.25315  ORF Transcript_8424/g.25315 Transcript_8424/m.25315 type:complete len:139 (+) Transcript_8424:722-1138(+)